MEGYSYGGMFKGVLTKDPPHPVIVTIRDIKDYIRVLLYSYYTTITGWGVLLRNTVGFHLQKLDLKPKPF